MTARSTRRQEGLDEGLLTAKVIKNLLSNEFHKLNEEQN